MAVAVVDVAEVMDVAPAITGMGGLLLWCAADIPSEPDGFCFGSGDGDAEKVDGDAEKVDGDAENDGCDDGGGSGGDMTATGA